MEKHTYLHARIVIISALLICLFNTHVYSYWWSVHSWYKNNQKVLVLGDSHMSCAADARDKALATQLFTYCAENQHPTYVLFEHIPYAYYLLTDKDQQLFDQHEHENYMPLAGYISQYALWNKYAYKSIKFNESDLRYSNEQFKILTVVRTALNQYLDPNIKSQSTALTPAQKRELLTLIDYMLKQSNTTSQNDCSYNDITTALDNLVSYCTYVHTSNYTTALNELMKRLSNKIQDFNKQLQDFSKQFNTSSVLASVYTFILKSNTPRDLETLFESYKPLIEEIADLGFIKELLDTLTHNNRIILYTGNWHSTTLNKVLESLGFTCTHNLVDLPQEPTVATQQQLLATIEEFVK